MTGSTSKLPAQGAGTPTLVIIMGTSGSGKSTLGASLASALAVPFIDGDDLHPAANVAKMAAGTPLDDDDRGPWLKAIRAKAEETLQVGSTQDSLERPPQPDGSVPGEEKRRLAEVFETSGAAEHPKVAQSIREAGSDEASQIVTEPSEPSASGSQVCPRAMVIACSSLKRVYRELLRGERESLTSTSPSSASSPLRVLHVYVRVTPEELLRRMTARKGHFMKEEMLKSQLATLEEPVPGEEEGIISLADGPKEDVERRAEQALREVLGV